MSAIFLCYEQSFAHSQNDSDWLFCANEFSLDSRHSKRKNFETGNRTSKKGKYILDLCIVHDLTLRLKFLSMI